MLAGHIIHMRYKRHKLSVAQQTNGHYKHLLNLCYAMYRPQHWTIAAHVRWHSDCRW
jgi:hypothetical protein